MPLNNPLVAIQCAQELAERRRRLYVLFMSFVAIVLLFALIVGSVYSLEAVGPRVPNWVSAMIELFLPGLPARVLRFAERHPIAVLLVGIVLYLLRRVSQRTKEAAQEYAFQAWRLTVGLGGPTTNAVPCRVGWVPAPYVTIAVMVAIVTIVGVNISAPQRWIANAYHNGRSSCTDATRGDCWLAAGETVLVAVRADEPRNETGLLLEKEACYAARFVASAGWRAGRKIQPLPEGFDFDVDVLGFEKFWWMEWLRPHPKGAWFEVIGRIGRQPEVFSVLDRTDVGGSHRFIASSDGELVLQVNDVRYENNAGVMTIEVTRC